MESRKYKYPKINMFFPSKIHVDYENMYDVVSHWTTQFKMQSSDRKKYASDKFVKAACMFYPYGDYDRILLITKWVIHTFDLDDFIELNVECPFFDSLRNHGNENKDVITLLDKCFESEQTPLVASFCDLWTQLKSYTNKRWQQRFAENYIWYLKSNKWEHNVIETKRIPILAEYLEYRHYTACMDPFVNLIEVARNIFIPDFVMANVALQRFNYLTSNIVAFVNDIYSYEKETRMGQINNLVTVVKHEYNITNQEAIEKATELVNNEIKKHRITQQMIPVFEGEMNECVAKYVHGCNAWIVGNHDWGFESARYTN